MRQQKTQIISRIRRAALSVAPLLVILFASSPHATAQQAVRDGIFFHNVSAKEIAFDFFLDKIDSKAFGNNSAIFESSATNGYTNETGKPMLPVYRQIICIPESYNFRIDIIQENRLLTPQNTLGCNAPLSPSAPPTFKSSSAFEYLTDSTIYSSDSFYGTDIIRLEPIGKMRGSRLAILTIAPVRYNPVSRLVDICTHISAKIAFPDTIPTTPNLMLQGLVGSQGNDPKEYDNQLISNNKAYTFLIVAPQQFQHTLQPLVSWKRQEGFIVDEYYPSVATRDAIKAHLQQLYDQATPNRPAPLFILLVGDVQQIPVWPGKQHIPGIDVHRTDLFYADFTNDDLPDALLGRISASDTATLAGIISKTIDYEQFNISDSSYFGRSLLVAGKEETHPAPEATNGQVNYLKNCIMQHDNQHDTICYYNPGSDTMSPQIQNHLRQGVGFVNYTAHCTAEGWRHPTLSNNDIDSLSLGNHLFVSINNCCRANEISGDCFGEHLLRKAPGGAVGVIGASNETLWEEDYYWSVGGNGNPTLTPSYSPSMPGALDRFLHTQNTSTSQQAVTQSQILLAGNWAVTASGSPYYAFYWEIYSLLGDPSLMPYIGIPRTQLLDIDSIHTGDTTISLRGTPGARVAATLNDTLYGICTVGDDSIGLIHTLMPVPDSLLVTATAQFHKPQQKNIHSTPPTTARLVVTQIAAQNTDGESISQLTLRDSTLLTVTIRNVGLTTANGHTLLITSGISIGQFHIGTLSPGQNTVVQLTVYPDTPSNEYLIRFETADTSVYWAMQKSYDLISPKININQPVLTHNGQIATSITPSTTYDIRLNLVNSGLGRARDLQVTLTGATTVAYGTLESGDTAQCNFTLTTPEHLDSLTLTFIVSHRTDTLVRTFTFPADSNVAIQQSESTIPNITMWPNPANNTITFNGIHTPTHITIYDIYGRTAKEFHIKNNAVTQYSIADLRCGIYSIVFTTEGQKKMPITKKLIITR